MKLAKNFQIDAVTYASQGNGILGIRDSGKSYTATAIAEKLLEAGIPFVTLDPIGVWKNLKYGKDGKKGYAVVVAGDDGDLPLTVESAPRIVRAAMQENIPLIIDMYSMSLSKADWKRIVQSTLEILLYENKKYGLRHVFIEEAAEFCPQRVGPESGRVYAEVEKLARMGGNASLGYTLINQRAEEVNKAVLELCDCLFLHRQKGRHSLTALGKWLDVGDVSSSREIIKSLPTLPQGECWVWEQGSQEPTHIKVLPKRTVHPDRRNPLKASKLVPTDVSKFLVALNKKLVAEAKPQVLIEATGTPADIKKAIKTAKGMEKQMSGERWSKGKDVFPGVSSDTTNTVVEISPSELSSLRSQLAESKQRVKALESVIEDFKKVMGPQFKMLQKLFGKIEHTGATAVDAGVYQQWLEKLQGKNREMLQVLIETPRLTRSQLGFKISMSTNSGTFATYLSKLRTLGLVKKDGEYIVLANHH